MKKDENLYFVAIIPQGEILADISKVKEYFSEKYASSASLNSDPHITLHMPFRYRDKKKSQLLKLLSDIAYSQNEFSVQLNNFGAFPPKTIYVDVEENPALIQLQDEIKRLFRTKLKLMNANYRDHAFKAHITVAYRDLKKQAFENAWKEFKDKKFNQNFKVNSIILLKHNSRRWEIDSEFIFKS